MGAPDAELHTFTLRHPVTLNMIARAWPHGDGWKIMEVVEETPWEVRVTLARVAGAGRPWPHAGREAGRGRSLAAAREPFAGAHTDS